MKVEILALLRECDGFLSGQELCDRFGVSRTAIWKAINQLKKEGYEIEAVQNRGYRLVSCPETLSKNELESRMKTKWVGKRVVYFDETGSTNADARREADNDAPCGTLVVADCQKSGKGRRGRSWQSPAGTDIYMSLLLKPTFSPDIASMLTLVTAISVAEGIHQVTGLEAKIKWPNDIVVNRKKVCGILTEMNAERDFIHYVVVGVGINVNMDDFAEEIKDMATSLKLELGTDVSRAELIPVVMECFEANFELFCREKNLSALKERYNELLVNKRTLVKVLDPKGEFSGIAGGITDTGELIVYGEDGKITNVYAGEVSVRGMYGYV